MGLGSKQLDELYTRGVNHQECVMTCRTRNQIKALKKRTDKKSKSKHVLVRPQRTVGALLHFTIWCTTSQEIKNDINSSCVLAHPYRKESSKLVFGRALFGRVYSNQKET